MKCDFYEPCNLTCNGTKECETCTCGGDTDYCTHYPEKRKQATQPAVKPEWKPREGQCYVCPSCGRTSNGYDLRDDDGYLSCPVCGTDVEILKDSDAIHNPSYYRNGKIEVIDFILDKKLDFCRGNVVKYVCRAGLKSKETELQDLEKARKYLDFAIEKIKKGE